MKAQRDAIASQEACIEQQRSELQAQRLTLIINLSPNTSPTSNFNLAGLVHESVSNSKRNCSRSGLLFKLAQNDTRIYALVKPTWRW